MRGGITYQDLLYNRTPGERQRMQDFIEKVQEANRDNPFFGG